MQITAFLSIGSTYTFLTALRLRGVIEREGLDLRFRPFSVRAIMREMNNIPFPPEKEAKVRYMWRDIERRAGGDTGEIERHFPGRRRVSARSSGRGRRRRGCCTPPRDSPR